MIRIEVKDMNCEVELKGNFGEVMTDTVCGVLCALKAAAKEEKMPIEVVIKAFIKGLKKGYKNMPEMEVKRGEDS